MGVLLNKSINRDNGPVGKHRLDSGLDSGMEWTGLDCITEN